LSWNLGKEEKWPISEEKSICRRLIDLLLSAGAMLLPEIQDFMEAISTGREPKSGKLAAGDTVGVLYAAYLSAERKGIEVEVPLDPALEAVDIQTF
jgi:hypothetical protein